MGQKERQQMDIKCVVCGEPWDARGVRNGDMEPWEAELFRQGAGCPCCAGVDNGFEVSSLADIENGDEDPGIRLTLNENKASRPPWVKPEPKVLWKCEACGIEHTEEDRGSKHDLPTPLPYRGMTGTPITVCDDCVERCDDCGTALCGTLSHDVYDGLGSFEGRCIDCYEVHESEREAEEHYEKIERLAWNTLCNDGMDCADAAALLSHPLHNERDVEKVRMLWNRRPCDPRAMVRYLKGK